MRALQDYTRLKRARRRRRRSASDLAWALVLDSLVFARRGRDPLARPLRGPAAPGRSSSGRRPPLDDDLAERPTRPHRGGHADERRARSSTPSPGCTARARPRCTRCAAVSFAVARRRAGRGDGPVRLRQVDPADPGRRPRRPDRRARSRSRAPTWRRSAHAGRARMRRTSIGYVFQDFNLIPALTAAENVALPLELDGVEQPRRPRARPGPRSTRSASASSPTGSPTTCPAASSSGSRSPGPSSASAG